MHILETERLRLRELTAADAPFMLKLLNDPGWLEFIGDRGVRTIAQTEAYFEAGPIKSYRDHSFGLWLVKRKEDQAPIGICGIVNRDSLPHPDIGFAFLEQYCGRGYAYESAAATLAYAKSALKMPRVLAITLPANQRSAKLLQKLGMTFEKLMVMPEDASELMVFGIDFG